MVEAGAGFGKTTLIDEFVRRLPAGLRVARAAPIELEMDTSWSTLRAVIDGWPSDELAPPIAVVTGAFHTVALPWARAKRAARADAATTTLLTAHSDRSLASLYPHGRYGAWGEGVWRALEDGSSTPHEA